MRKLILIIALLFLSVLMIDTKREAAVEDGIVIAFAGDVMIGRMVNENLNNVPYEHPWGDMRNLVREADLFIINLETTLTESDKAVLKVFNYKADPDRVEVLKRAGVDIVNLANNHILDFDVEGMRETIQVLDQANILHVGAGDNENEARRHVVVEKDGIKIGIIGYSDNEPAWAAKEQNPGVNYVKVGDTEEILNDIEKLKPEVDLLIVTIHWGPNMRDKPSEEFINFAHELIDNGVDIIHGHSAHVFQGVEIYNNKLIMYDAGDFVDDYAVDPVLRNDRSFLFNVFVDKKGIKKLELIPVRIDFMQVNKAKMEDYKETVDRMKELSSQFGTEFKEEDDKLTVELNDQPK
jgi:poly-gamma-glutamate capsule biosynthesis protein CapA/YwtB (metallophosphatase superfamily)